jgi:hypothetical protein
MPYFGSYELTSPQSLERVHDAPILREGREQFAAWLQADHPEWVLATSTVR